MDLFGIIWLAIIAFAVFWQALWTLRAFRTGSATYYFRYEFSRFEQPFQFWMLVASRIAGIFLAGALFVLGLQVFRS